MPGFAGLKVTRDPGAAKRWGLNLVPSLANQGAAMVLEKAGGTIAWGGNSGFQCLNWVLHCGARQIALVAFDMRIDLGLHFFGRHRAGLNNPSAASIGRWRRAIDEQAPRLRALGVDVVNCSEISALEAYPKMTLPQALARFAGQPGAIGQ